MEDLKDRRLLSLIPWKIGLCAGLSFAAVCFLPISIANKGDYLILITGLIAAQGIMLGMSTNAIQHVIQNISAPGFSSFLEENNVLPYYLFFIQYFQITGIVSLIVLIASAVLLISVNSLLIFQICLSTSFSLIVYSLLQTADTSVLLRDVVYYRSKYDVIRMKNAKLNGKVHSINSDFEE